MIKKKTKSLKRIVEDALAQLNKPKEAFRTQDLFEFTVSPGIANKQITATQLTKLAEIVGDDGVLTYTPDHELKVSIKTENPTEITSRLKESGWLLSPAGDVVKIIACDFCDGDKQQPIPYAEELHERLGGLRVPKQLNIGFNGCGMACYGAVTEDIGIVFRRKKFDIFLGAKTIGRNAHVGIPVVEGLEPEKLVPLIVKIVEQFQKEGLPNERFYKFFKRVGNIQGFEYREVPTLVTVEPNIC